MRGALGSAVGALLGFVTTASAASELSSSEKDTSVTSKLFRVLVDSSEGSIAGSINGVLICASFALRIYDCRS